MLIMSFWIRNLRGISQRLRRHHDTFVAEFSSFSDAIELDLVHHRFQLVLLRRSRDQLIHSNGDPSNIQACETKIKVQLALIEDLEDCQSCVAHWLAFITSDPSQQ